jgi:hypothetical protein
MPGGSLALHRSDSPRFDGSRCAACWLQPADRNDGGLRGLEPGGRLSYGHPVIFDGVVGAGSRAAVTRS